MTITATNNRLPEVGSFSGDAQVKVNWVEQRYETNLHGTVLKKYAREDVWLSKAEFWVNTPVAMPGVSVRPAPESYYWVQQKSGGWDFQVTFSTSNRTNNITNARVRVKYEKIKTNSRGRITDRKVFFLRDMTVIEDYERR